MRVIEVKEFGKEVAIAIVVSRYHPEVTEPLLQTTLTRLQELEVDMAHITVTHVPGVIEIPLVAKRFASAVRYDAIIALGAVIGDDVGHDFLCDQVTQGCLRVMLDCDLPVVFGVLRTETLEEAQNLVNGKKGYRGREMADVALEMVSLLQQI